MGILFLFGIHPMIAHRILLVTYIYILLLVYTEPSQLLGTVSRFYCPVVIH